MRAGHIVHTNSPIVRIGVITVGLALVLSACSESGDSPSTNGIDGAAPPEVAEFANDWPLPNRDQRSSRAVLEGPIDSTTVADLNVAWRYDVPGNSTFGNLATNPLILGDTVYVGDLTGMAHAIDRETGEGRWASGESGTLFGPTGVAVGWGKVFGTEVGPRGRGQNVVAYDIDTGDRLWSTEITFVGDEINVSPFVYDGLVYASTSGFPVGVRGSITALEQETGEIVWTFHTIESEDIWGNQNLTPQTNHGGGVWYPPALADDGETLYFGVGNPYPFPGAPGHPNGSSRPGDNRWTSGTVALDPATGELKWGFQAFPHDLFDRDHVLTALADTTIDGEDQTVLVTAGKGGVVFGHDPATGDVLWSTPVGRHQNDHLTEFEGSLEVLPGGQGGLVTPPAAADGVFYGAVINAPITYELPEESSTGFATRLGALPSNVVAIDVRDGSIVWDVEVDDSVLGGMTVVKDLVFTSTLSGKILALDRATGEIVWRYQADGGINGWPAVAGDLIVFPVGFGAPAHLLALRLPGEDS